MWEVLFALSIIILNVIVFINRRKICKLEIELRQLRDESPKENILG